MLGGEAIEDDAARGNQHGGEHDAEAHLGFPDAVILASEARGKAVG
jgi:hypothetical protein